MVIVLVAENVCPWEGGSGKAKLSPEGALRPEIQHQRGDHPKEDFRGPLKPHQAVSILLHIVGETLNSFLGFEPVDF